MAQIRQAIRETLAEVVDALNEREIKSYDHLSDAIYNGFLRYDLFAQDYLDFESDIIEEIRKDLYLEAILDHRNFNE